MRIAITGSTGFIGSALAERLEAEGHDVVRVRRGDPTDAGASWNPDTGWFREGALEGVDAVLHMTGVSIGAKRWSDARKQALRASRIDATRVLVDHLATLQQRPAVLVTASAVGFYGDRGAETLTETSERGSGFLADLVADWEREAARAETLGVRTVFARFAPVLSRGSEILDRLLPPFRMGVGGPIGSGRQWFSWVTLRDVVEAVRFLALHSDLSGPVNVVAPQPATNSEFTKAIASAVRRPAFMPLPPPALKLLFGAERASETLLVSQRAVPERLLAAGFTFADPEIQGAMREIVRGGGALAASAA